MSPPRRPQGADSGQQYADEQAELGIHYYRLSTGDRAANLEQAIACFHEALRFLTAEVAQAQYAAVLTYLGIAHAELPTGDRAANLARAISCYTQALRFRTAEATPVECRLTAGNLDDIRLGQGRWAEAHTAYSFAIRASELLYQATGSETGRQAESGAARDAVAADAYCLARLGRLAEAVQRLESGRARALGEALARDGAALEEASGADRAAFVAAVDRIRALEAEGRRSEGAAAPAAPGGHSIVELSAELVRAREDLTGVIDRIRSTCPGSWPRSLISRRSSLRPRRNGRWSTCSPPRLAASRCW